MLALNGEFLHAVLLGSGVALWVAMAGCTACLGGDVPVGALKKGQVERQAVHRMRGRQLAQ